MSVKFVDYDCKLIEPILSEEELIYKIEYAYRVCYNSINKMKDESIEDSIKFVKDKIKLGHGSPLEHVSISVEAIIDRGILAEWTRHRVGSSYSVESTRYCKYSNDIECIIPTEIRNASDDIRSKYIYSIEESCNKYQELLDLGVSPQSARSVLPHSLRVKMVVTHTLRAWYHFFDLRYKGTYGKPHPDFVYLAGKIYNLFHKNYPHIFE